MENITITVPEDLKRSMGRMRHVNWSSVARRAFQEAIRLEGMREAAEGIDRLRKVSKTPKWSGATEIRKWRDASRSS